MMRAFLKMTLVEFKLFIRQPVGFFFTFAFPLVILLVFGSIFGNDPVEEFGGKGTVDLSVPGYIGMLIGTLGMIGLPISLATYREQGILRRFSATPLRPIVVLAAQVLVNLVMLLAGVILIIVAGRLIYDLQLPDNIIPVIIAILLGGISFLSVGFVLAGLLSTPRTAQAVGMALFFPMLFLAGGAIPREIFPEAVRRVGDFLPLTHVVNLIKDLWFGEGWNVVSLLVLVAVFIISLVVSSRTFRWE
jgi:ABC-2 type transport system permease protein